MITLDCSDYIDNNVLDASLDEVQNRYDKIPKDIRAKLENKYLNKTFDISPRCHLNFNSKIFKQIVLIYLDAIGFTIDIYKEHIESLEREIDFEMSIDET